MFPITAKFNEAGRRTHRMVIGIKEGLHEDGRGTAYTLVHLADIGGGGYTRDMTVMLDYEDVVRMIQEASSKGDIVDFSEHAPKSSQKPDGKSGRVIGLIRRFCLG